MFEGLEKYFQLLYTDRMDITTTAEVTRGDSVNNEYPAVPQQVNVSCRISFPNKDKVTKDEPTHERVELNPVIFCDPGIVVLAGDKIQVRRCRKDGSVFATFAGLAIKSGKPNVWVNHQEFELDMSGDA